MPLPRSVRWTDRISERVPQISGRRFGKETTGGTLLFR